jgi:hypothetical protein
MNRPGQLRASVFKGYATCRTGQAEDGMNPLYRELMLEETNRQVDARLRLLPGGQLKVIDLSYGLGTPMQQFARCFPKYQIISVSLVPWLVDMAEQSTEGKRPCKR